MRILLVFNDIKNKNNLTRPFEREALEKHFNFVAVCDLSIPLLDIFKAVEELKIDVIFWKLNVEKTNYFQEKKALMIYNKFKNLRHINEPRGFKDAHAKEKFFESIEYVFRNVTPKWSYDYDRMQYPYLLRWNNGNTGEGSYLVTNETEKQEALKNLYEKDYKSLIAKYGESLYTQLIGIQFVDHKYKNYRYSYRIIVAGNEIITGYARLSKDDDWVSITSKFTKDMGEDFIHLNKECEKFCVNNKKEIVDICNYVFNNYCGIDVVFDDNGNHYYLEIQPEYSAGNINYNEKPYYNPDYAELVEFIQSNEKRIEKELPMYYNYWLNKEKHFDACFKALKESF